MPPRIDEDQERLLYPDSDGKPMADNTLQLQWIVILYGNLCALFHEAEEVVVFADLLWYAVHGDPSACTAPDTMVVFGRRKGYRGSYKVWCEENVAPQVVFEVLSPNNTRAEMDGKFAFYERHGVEEYYLLNPYSESVSGWRRRGRKLRSIEDMNGWVSPRLGIRFAIGTPDLVIYYPDGREFLSFEQLAEQESETRRLAESARHETAREKRQREKAERDTAREKRQREKAQREAERANAERQKAEREVERLRRQLRDLGLDPDDLDGPKR
jgi:Uma2 family endonuclease